MPTHLSQQHNDCYFGDGNACHITQVTSVETETTPDMGKCMKTTTAGQVQCCFTSAETSRTIKDGEPRTATSTFTQLLSSNSMLLYVHRNHKAYQGRVAQDGHLDFHTAPEFDFNVALRPQKP